MLICTTKYYYLAFVGLAKITLEGCSSGHHQLPTLTRTTTTLCYRKWDIVVVTIRSAEGRSRCALRSGSRCLTSLTSLQVKLGLIEMPTQTRVLLMQRHKNLKFGKLSKRCRTDSNGSGEGLNTHVVLSLIRVVRA